jgi:hypothetical protein
LIYSNRLAIYKLYLIDEIMNIYFFRIIALLVLSFVISTNVIASLIFDDALCQLSRHHMKGALEIAQREGRELHILFGADPSERHISQVIARERARAEQEAGSGVANSFKAPIRIFFTKAEEATVRKFSSAETPILSGSFNDTVAWHQALQVLTPEGPIALFTGAVDKMYFDVCVHNCTSWNSYVLESILSVLKKSGALYFPFNELSSKTLCGAKKVNWEHPIFCKHSDDYLCKSGIFFDSNFKTSAEGVNIGTLGNVGPLTYKFFNVNDGYPDIGFDLREGGGSIGKQYAKVMAYDDQPVRPARLVTQECHFGALDDQLPFKLICGFSSSEVGHRWTNSKQALLQVATRQGNLQVKKLIFKDTKAYDLQDVTISLRTSLGTNVVGKYSYNENVRSHTMEISFPDNIEPGIAEILFDIPNAKSPGPQDPRILGIAFGAAEMQFVGDEAGK